MALDVIPIVLTVTTSIVQIAAFCVAGYIAAIRGVIDCKCRRQLNRLNIGIFTPALVFGKVAFFLTPEKLAGLWVIPASFAIITFVSFASAWCLGKMFGLSRQHLNVTIAGAMFMNTNTIPIALIQSLSLSLEKLKMNSLDTPDKELGRAFSYLAVYSLLGTLLRWSYGVKLLEPSEQKGNEKRELKGSYAINDCEKVAFPSSVGHDCSMFHVEDTATPQFVDLAVPTRTQGAYRISCATAFTSESDLGTPSKPSVRFSYPTAFGAYSNLLGPNGSKKEYTRMSSATAFSVESEITHCDITGEIYKERRKSCRNGPLTIPEAHPSNEYPIFFDDPTRLQPIWENQTGEVGEANSPAAPEKVAAPLPGEEKSVNRWKKLHFIDSSRVPSGVMIFIQTVRKFINPPLISSVLSIVIACIPPLQHWLSGIQILRNFLNSAGNASIPITLVVLGSFFSSSTSYKSSRKAARSAESTSQFGPSSQKSSKNQTKTVALALISRHLITPLILLPLIYILSKFTGVTIFADPIFLLTTVLLVGAPPAITLAQMATEQDGDLDKLVSRLLFWSFVFITPLTTLLLVGIAIMIHDTRHG
ncbi:hypothetical protein PGT21_007917 [Puccinia graminis f. sp. tritici]|uniref:Auxin efflux carrier n=1 Tax=Puccinia graminis f. sp. tritici TaxID=56615 RepID=A0A5B0LY17_PUCGR|nr:hypothetical protein PGT21_007917 [Puccinia graminis f. sp. tritici]